MEERVREEPRISINKLGEYLTATPSRRRRIVFEQKRPSSFQVIYYQSATNVITRFISSGGNDYELLTTESERLMELEPSSEYEQSRYLSNAEAIDSFLNICDDLPLDDIEATIGHPNPPKITIDEVEISVRPEIVLTTETRDNETLTGTLKLHISKNLSLGSSAGQFVATLLHRYAQEYLSDSGTSLRLAIVVDVFAEEFYTAPRSYRRRMTDIEAACTEIRLIWPTV